MGKMKNWEKFRLHFGTKSSIPMLIRYLKFGG